MDDAASRKPGRLDAMNGRQHLGPGRLLLTDAGVALILLNDGRRRALTRLTGLSGLSKDESVILTLILLGAAAKALGDTAPSIGGPNAGDLMLGGATLTEIAHLIAGSPSRSVRGFGGLLAFALIWKYHPVARGSFKVGRGSAHVIAATERKLRTYYKARSLS
jgi:hypothetical protein